jgi:hypothetical protein
MFYGIIAHLYKNVIVSSIQKAWWDCARQMGSELTQTKRLELKRSPPPVSTSV